MGLNWRQFELGVLRPTLVEVASVMPSPEVAVKLVGETCWHESDRLQALGQYPRWRDDDGYLLPEPGVFGPGLGIASIEEPTWEWMAGPAGGNGHHNPIAMRHYGELAHDLRLNVIACRLRYFLDPAPLPPDTLEDRATYWWQVYNRGQVDRRGKYREDALVIPWVK